tara:strand:+ start:3955 stop:4683 length:729 start_codon:yes stop_codon:yes gene_type:complete
MSISQIAQPYRFFGTITQSDSFGTFGGGGNGFPFSIANWEARFRDTSSMPQKSGMKNPSIMSFNDAIRVYWNLYGVEGNVEGTTKSASFARASSGSTPVDRIQSFAFYNDSDSDFGTSGIDFASLSLSSNSDFVIYFSGNTNNILGYGFEDFIEAKAHSNATVGSQTGTTEHNVKIQSHFDVFQSDSTVFGRTQTYTYENVDISGIQFVKETEVIKRQLSDNIAICPDPGTIQIDRLDFFQY